MIPHELANSGAFVRRSRFRDEDREIKVGHCQLVTISTDNISETNEYRSGVGAHWPFLSDAGRVIQKDLDIAKTYAQTLGEQD